MRRRRHRHHRSWRRRLFRSSTSRMAFFLVLGLFIIGSLITVLPGALDMVSTLMSIPDAASLSEMERKAQSGR